MKPIIGTQTQTRWQCSLCVGLRLTKSWRIILCSTQFETFGNYECDKSFKLNETGRESYGEGTHETEIEKASIISNKTKQRNKIVVLALHFYLYTQRRFQTPANVSFKVEKRFSTDRIKTSTPKAAAHFSSVFNFSDSCLGKRYEMNTLDIADILRAVAVCE